MSSILNTTQLHTVLAHWDIPPIRSIQALQNNHRIFKIISQDQPFTLKDISDAPNLLRLEFTRDVLTHVARSGLRVLVPLLSQSAQCAVSFRGRLYTLSEFIEAGDYPSEPELQPELFYQTGRAIAQLHQVLAAYPDPEASRRTWREDFADQVTQWLASLSTGLPQPHAAVAERIEMERRASIEGALLGLPEQLIHRNCHPGNILAQGTHVIGFIDCDHLCIGPRVFDLAYYAVHHLKWVTDDAQATERWLTYLPHLLKGYSSQQRLSPAEVSALPYAMMTYHLLLSAWFLSRAQLEPIALELRALDWMHTHFDAIVDVIMSS